MIQSHEKINDESSKIFTPLFYNKIFNGWSVRKSFDYALT
jgi:hypothetical protein